MVARYQKATDKGLHSQFRDVRTCEVRCIGIPWYHVRNISRKITKPYLDYSESS